MIIVPVGNLKNRRILNIARLLQDEEEVVISVRDKPRCVVMGLARYDFRRESEIPAAWTQTRADVAARRYRCEGADAHMARLTADSVAIP